jgi:hypothetical protein
MTIRERRRYVRRPFAFLIPLLLISASTSLADSRVPHHSCSKPTMLPNPTSNFEVYTLRTQIGSYKSCITEFIEQQKAEMKIHQKAAKDAAAEWNAFVREQKEKH